MIKLCHCDEVVLHRGHHHLILVQGMVSVIEDERGGVGMRGQEGCLVLSVKGRRKIIQKLAYMRMRSVFPSCSSLIAFR